MKTKNRRHLTPIPPPRPVLPARKYFLRLYVAGASARSRLAVLRIQRLCAAELKPNCSLEVIDIYQQPALARARQILATPTLVVEFPKPVRRFIGNLLDTAGLFVALNLAAPGRLTP